MRDTQAHADVSPRSPRAPLPAILARPPFVASLHPGPRRLWQRALIRGRLAVADIATPFQHMQPNAHAPRGGRPDTLLDSHVAAWLALAIGLALSIGLWQFFNNHFANRAQEQFANRAEAARNVLLSRMDAYTQVLRGGAALFAASTAVSREEWHDYVASLNLADSLPGIQGTGFAEMVPAAQLQEHLAAVRAAGFPDYRIHPPGERALYASILYLEPFSGRNLQAFGYDMYADPVRREAMQRACDTGRPALSGKTTLVQETSTDVQPGFLIYLPVYRGGRTPNGVDERRAALRGFVYSPFRSDDMMRSIFATDLADTGIELFDGSISAGNLLYASGTPSGDARHVVVHPIEIAGRQWLARFSSTRAFETANFSAEPDLILIGGLALSLMLFSVISINARHRQRLYAAATRLAQTRDEFRTLVENIPGVVFRCEIEAPWVVMHVSQNIAALTGATPDEFTSGHASFGDFILPEDRQRIESAIEAAYQQHTAYEVEYRMRARDGRIHWVSERGRIYVTEDGSALWLDGVIIDVTERKAAEDAIRNLAFVDTLTHLPNRRFLLDRLRQGLAGSRRHGRHGALLFVDLDHFKQVNDTYGHEAGDKLLCEVARRLKQCVREGDTVARLGGDEFVVLLEELGDNGGEACEKGALIAEKIRSAINAPFELGDARHTCTPSIGVTGYGPGDESAEALLRRADAAMYCAKASGRNRCEAIDGAEG
ncbi:GGDEF domain-containing protein [Thauera linaloolentis]|uniref:GGDEF domain-containing protein n=1 Tax=Thauera linaloolentis TaxID=76112 RepID=UPI000A70A1EC|nr:GGDEF domain-containing protein [Thauera linaloolentis]MCM8565817.1 GGDEF domain-containing protein [Thauera linaloolentis]